MIKIHPHLCFNGQCEEAFNEYQRILGGTINMMMRYSESPLAQDVPADWQNRVIHASLKLGEFELAGADLLAYKKPQGFYTILNFSEKSEAEKVFNSLARGGEIEMPFAETFWSAGFGVLRDRFGIPWEINSEHAPQNV